MSSWAEFAAALTELHVRCGSPPYRLIARRGGSISPSTVGNLLRGTVKPTRLKVEQFLAGCGADGATTEAFLARWKFTGDATAPAPAPSMYVRAVVERIAPTQLLDRERELAELARFCAGPDRSMWWRGDPWSGKSALLATFALRPPPGVVVASFFVNSRLPEHGDAPAFAQWVRRQLRWHLDRKDEPAAEDLTTLGTQIEEAAGRLSARGRELILLVDGLDEDTGPWGSTSIASLLPELIDRGIRIIFSSRRDALLPRDAQPDHRLWAAPVRPLVASDHVRKLELLARREIEWMVSSDRLPERLRPGRCLLGLLAAAGSGLTFEDLAELTEWSNADLKTRLTGVPARLLAMSPTGSGETWFFTHDMISDWVADAFGLQLAGHRENIHVWAGRSAPDWTDRTPTYVRHGYPAMLIRTADRPRLTALATSAARQRLLLRSAGGEAASLTEIATALEMHRPAADFTSPVSADPAILLRLALRRAVIDRRTAKLPVRLAAAWAVLGETDHARAVAGSFTDPARSAEAHALIADPPRRRDRPGPRGRDRALQAAWAAGLIRPRRLPADAPAEMVYEAEDRLRHLYADWERAEALAEVFDALVRLGEADRAHSLAQGWMRAADLKWPETWAAYLPMILRTEEPQRMIVRLPERGYFSEDEGPSRPRLLRDIVRLALVDGRFGHAWAAALELHDHDFSTTWLRRVATAVVQCGADDGIGAVPDYRAEYCWIEMAAALIDEGDLAAAERVIDGQLADSRERGRLLTDLALAAAADDPGRARAWLLEVERAARVESDGADPVRLVTEAVAALDGPGRTPVRLKFDRPFAIGFSPHGEAVNTLTALADAANDAARRGDFEDAEGYAQEALRSWREQQRINEYVRHSMEWDPSDPDGDLSGDDLRTAGWLVVEAFVAARNLDVAERLAAAVEPSYQSGVALTALAVAQLEASRVTDAVATIRHVADPASSFVTLSGRARRLGNTPLAHQLLCHAILIGKPIDLLPAIAAVAPDTARDVVTELAAELGVLPA